MKKSDLKNGMIIELRNGDMCIVFNNKLLDTLNSIYLDDYSNNLIELNGNSVFDIVKIYEDEKMLCLNDRHNIENLKLIWERKEIDWSKVPFGTKVRVWNKRDNNKYVGKFLGFNENGLHKYYVFVDVNKAKVWDYCELIEEPKEEVTYDEMVNGYISFCENNGELCQSCEYTELKDCTIAYIANNYNVTRK